MSKFEIKKTVTLSIPASFQKELADFVMILEGDGLDFYLPEIVETIINKASKTDKFRGCSTDIDTVYMQYREGE